MKNFFALLLAAIAAFLCSCATEPMTGRKQLMLNSLEEEREMAATSWRDVNAAKIPSRQKELADFVSYVGKKVASQAENGSQYKWEFALFQDMDPNASSLPTGQIIVNDGLFMHVKNEAELAAVLAHEIAHVVARHGSERMSQAYAVEQGKIILTTALEYTNLDAKDKWLAAYTGATNIGIIYPFSRQHEFIADRMAMIFMARAGYNPEAAITFWSRFADKASDTASLKSLLLSTHPSDWQRLASMKDILPEAKSIYDVSEKIGLGATFTVGN